MTEPIRTAVFPSRSAERIWRERWCGTCFQQDEAARQLFDHGTGCPILARALRGTVPVEWKTWRRGRARQAQDLYRCSDYRDRPPVHRPPRDRADGVQGSLIDEPAHGEKLLVAVDGWPDYRAIERATTEPPCPA